MKHLKTLNFSRIGLSLMLMSLPVKALFVEDTHDADAAQFSAEVSTMHQDVMLNGGNNAPLNGKQAGIYTVTADEAAQIAAFYPADPDGWPRLVVRFKDRHGNNIRSCTISLGDIGATPDLNRLVIGVKAKNDPKGTCYHSYI